MKSVITYRLAYVDEEISLCKTCIVIFKHSLGPVQWGAHDGVCDLCERKRGES